MLDTTLLITFSVLLLLLNAAGVFLVLMQLPGTWLMLAATSAMAWWRWENQLITIWCLIALLVLAILGEVVEFLGAAAGAAKEKSSKRAVVLAVVGGVAGALVGTFAIPIPIIGTLIGAALGSGTCSMLGELWAGRDKKMAWQVGKGAAIGRLWGSIGKVAVAGVMWVVVAVALLWP